MRPRLKAGQWGVISGNQLKRPNGRRQLVYFFNEYANTRRRGLAVSLMSTGYGIGATLGGVLSLLLIKQMGWQAVFIAGGITSLAMLLITMWLLPESLDYSWQKNQNKP